MNNKLSYILHLADNALILGHRNSEWCGHGPVLEQDIAITNISLDLIGQARNFYQYAAGLKADGSTEDTLAYLRDANEFRNCILTELPKGDWAFTILRQFFFSNYQHLLYQQMQHNKDEQLSAIAAKAIKEVTYHLRWSSEWVIRLGDGTEESQRRIRAAVKELWPYTGELLETGELEQTAGVVMVKNEWMNTVNRVFEQALLTVPSESEMNVHTGGREGKHTASLDHILADLQYLQRTYPNSEW